jgi:hypothetical protein
MQSSKNPPATNPNYVSREQSSEAVRAILVNELVSLPEALTESPKSEFYQSAMETAVVLNPYAKLPPENSNPASNAYVPTATLVGSNLSMNNSFRDDIQEAKIGFYNHGGPPVQNIFESMVDNELKYDFVPSAITLSRQSPETYKKPDKSAYYREMEEALVAHNQSLQEYGEVYQKFITEALTPPPPPLSPPPPLLLARQFFDDGKRAKDSLRPSSSVYQLQKIPSYHQQREIVVKNTQYGPLLLAPQQYSQLIASPPYYHHRYNSQQLWSYTKDPLSSTWSPPSVYSRLRAENPYSNVTTPYFSSSAITSTSQVETSRSIEPQTPFSSLVQTTNTNPPSQESPPQETRATEQNPISKNTENTESTEGTEVTESKKNALISPENETKEKSDPIVTTNLTQGLTTLLSSLIQLLKALDISPNSQKKETGTAPEIVVEATRRSPPTLIKPSNTPHPTETIHVASNQSASKETPPASATR